MMSSWSGWRSAMVCAGWPSSQRNRLGRHPDLAGGNQRLGQHLERAGLGEVGRPTLKVGLRGEPLVEKPLELGRVSRVSEGSRQTQRHAKTERPPAGGALRCSFGQIGTN